MKCPRCGAEMTIDTHRKIPLSMCYECGYIEGRNLEGDPAPNSNYNRLKGLTLTETASFLSKGLKTIDLNVDEDIIIKWLMKPVQ